MIDARLLSSRRIRSTPYHSMVEQHGVSGFTVVNHTLLPKGFQRSVEEDYWHLQEHVQLWDVGCQRQIEVVGPDAPRLVQWMTPRDLGDASVGQCLYAPLIDRQGGMINDPIILKLAENRFWLSIADSDVGLWAGGLAEGMGLDVEVFEADVWPLAVQGPKADDLMAALFGSAIRDLGFFRFSRFSFQGHQILIARSGFSAQGGFEIYLDRSDRGESLWTALWEAGQPFNVSPGCPNLIERIEAGLLSYGNDMTREDSPLMCGLERFCDLDSNIECIGMDALRKEAADGTGRRIVGLRFGDRPCGSCSRPWEVLDGERPTGHVTSVAWSPRVECNVAIGMVETGMGAVDRSVRVRDESGQDHDGILCSLPMRT